MQLTYKFRLRDTADSELRRQSIAVNVGDVFGRLTVVEIFGPRMGRAKFICNCGVFGESKLSKLLNGHKSSCGCLIKDAGERLKNAAAEKNRKLQIGLRFGRLVLSAVYPTSAICDCGNIKNDIRPSLLLRGDLLSCGCLNKDNAKVKVKKIAESHRVALGRDPNLPMSSENSIQRNVLKTISPLVLARDNYSCALCGIHGAKFHVHHIEKFSDVPEKRMNLSNLVTLCLPCHKIAHDGNPRGKVNADIAFKLRQWTCMCGASHDRDTNAAKNIARRGLATLAEGALQ